MESEYARIPEDLSGIPLHTFSSQDTLIPAPLNHAAKATRTRNVDVCDEDEGLGSTVKLNPPQHDASSRSSWWFHRRSRGLPTKKRFSWRKPTGWRLGTTFAALLTFTILVINIILLGLASSIKPTATSVGREPSESIRPVKQGECGGIKELGIGLHLLINIVSTLLLGASNYCMQTISAPTRQDVDDAHSRGLFMDIGIPSMRNLGMIKTRRLIVWLCLGLSSIPWHLVYNSIIFVSTSNYMYEVYYADESFLQGAAFETELSSDDLDSIVDPDSSLSPEFAPYSPFEGFGAEKVQQDVMQSGKYEKLSNEECIREYAKNLIQERGNVILVIERPQNCSDFWQAPMNICVNSTTTSLYAALNYEVSFEADSNRIPNWYHWICTELSRYEFGAKDRPYLCSDGRWRDLVEEAEDWKVYGQKVQYCMSERLPSQCRLQVAINLIGVVIAFNVVKLVIIVMMTVGDIINQNPLVTIGDAIASFIERPDTRTEGMCLRSATEILASDDTQIVPAVVYRPHRNRWAAAVSGRRWWTASLMVLFSLVTVLGLLGFAVTALKAYGKDDFQSLWSLGIGAIAPHNLITGWEVPTYGEGGVVSTVLITNMPQVIFSFLYLILNGVVTSMSAAQEWSSHAHQSVHKQLRVSFPKGGQRSTFFLQMPYRFSVPMMAMSILMHWLISQSFFIAQVEEYRTGGGVSETTTGAFSPVAMFLTSLVMVVAFGIILGLARLRHLQEGMPVARNCSAAIAAACHGIPGTVLSERPVKWGVVVPAQLGRDGVGRCAFSNHPVEAPEPGQRYA